MKPTFLNFIRRYLRLLIIWTLLVIGGQIDAVVFFFGHIYYVVELVFSCVIAALFVRHLFLRKSIDAYSIEPDKGDSDFVRDWKLLDPGLKVTLAVVVFIGLYLGACWVAASVAK